MTEKSTASPERRRFLTMAGLGAATAGAAIGLSGKAGKAAAAEKTGGGARTGYRETEHVKRYYALARL